MIQSMNFLMPVESEVATKEFICKNGQWELYKGYRAGKFFKGFEIPVKNLKEAFNFLEQNQNYPVFMIHGGFIDGIDKTKMVRRSRNKSKDEKPPTLTNRNINLFCFDIDGFKGSHDIDLFITEQLPEAFHTADYVFQFSSSYGLTTNELKCHIFFWLEKSAYNIDIRDWIKLYNKSKEWGNIIDPAVLNPAQPIYIQKRICIGSPDPISNFIGYVKKEGNLKFVFDCVETEGKLIIPAHKEDYDLKAGIEQILTAQNYHEELNKLALSLLNKKIPPYTVKELLQGAMNSAEKKDQRWQERFDDIGRSVDTAVDIVDNPTIEEVLSWIANTDNIELTADYPKKVLGLSPMDRDTATTQITRKLGFGIAVVKKTIKIAENEAKIKAIEKAKAIKSKDRENRGIYEIEASISNSGVVAEIAGNIIAKSKKSPEVFAIAGGLCCVGLGKPKTIRQATKSDDLGVDYPKMPIITLYKKPFYTLAGRFEKDIAFVNEKGIDVECPMKSLHIIAEGTNENFKPLTGIIESPFIDNKWTLVQKQGYNKRTGLYTMLHHKLKIKKMKADVAYKYLTEEVFAEFPFNSELDKVVAVAAMMTAVQRPTISGDSGFPGFGIISPTQSSGKTTLAQLISYSIFNRPVAATTLTDDEVEVEKHLLGILQEGHSCVLFDNIKQGTQVTSNALAKIMSSDSFRGRQLGENKTIEVPCSVVWLFTGNGISFVGDFATRVYPININPKMADPNTRLFKRDNIGQWAMDNRKKIISAVLSIIIEGQNLKPKGGTRFKEWDKFVRQPLLKVSGIDINNAVKNNQQDDPIQLAKNSLFREIKNTFGDKKFTTKELIKQAFGSFGEVDTELGDAMEEMFGDDKKLQSIGVKLNVFVNQIADGLSLKKKKGQYAKWYIIEE